MHIAQVGFIKPILDKLTISGTSINPILERSGLKNFRMEDMEAYVPIDFMYNFLNEIPHVEGMSDFLGVFSKDLELQAISQWGALIAYAPDLLSACKLAEVNDKVMLTNESISLAINGHKAILEIGLDDGPILGRELHECINLALTVNGIRLAGGKDFAPTELHLQQETVPNLDILLPSGCDTKIYTGQPATGFVFESSLLTNPMLPPGKNGTSPAFEPAAPGTYTRKCELVVDASKGKFLPGIETMANVASLSESTLLRRLADEGTTYFEIIDNWRLKKALQLITDPNLSLKEITELLHYSNVPNFERAFKRWTNTTPGVFRNQSH